MQKNTKPKNEGSIPFTRSPDYQGFTKQPDHERTKLPLNRSVFAVLPVPFLVLVYRPEFHILCLIGVISLLLAAGHVFFCA